MKKIATYILALLFLTSCSKNKSNEIIVSGRLMQSCNTPAANKEGMIVTADAILSGPGEILYFTSDENGYFEAKHTGSGFTRFTVRVNGSSDVLNVDYLSGDKKELGEVYIFPQSASYYLYLDVDSTYTENDTLHYGNPGFPADGTSPWLKKAGPFSNGIIDTVPKAINPSSLPASFQNSNNPTIKLNYYINEYDSWTDGDKNVYIPTSHCQEEYQDVTLKIE